MARDVTLRQLEYLVAVADHGSLSAAAHTSHVSTAGIASALNDLEHLMDTPLTIRTRSKGVVLTAAGRVAVEKARKLLEHSRHFVESVDQEVGRMRGDLHVGSFTTLSPWVFPLLLEHFSSSFPDVALNVTESGSPQLLERLAAGKYDMIVLFASHLWAHSSGVRSAGAVPDPEELTVRMLHQARPRLIVSAAHPLARRGVVHLEELHGQPGMLLDVDPVREILTDVLARVGLAQNIRWSSPSVNVVRNVVGRGLAWSILVGMGSANYSPDGRPLVTVPIADPLPDNGIVAATMKHIGETPKAVEAIRVLRDGAA